MNIKQKRKYLFAVYLIIAITAVTFMVIGFSEVDSWKSILLNLSTELLAVALVFFLVDFLFTIDDWNLSEKVQLLLNQLKNERPDASKFFEPSPQLETYFDTADQIDLCGVTLTSTLNRGFSSIRERVFAGAHVRLLIIKPSHLPLQMAMSRSENTESLDYFKKRLESTLNDVEYMHKNLSEKKAEMQVGLGKFEVKLMDYAPSFGIISFDSHKPNATMFTEIYPHHSGYGNPPKFTLTKQGDTEWHKYFTEQFESMWSYAEDWNPGLSVDDEGTSSFMVDFPDTLKRDIQSTQELWMVGITLQRTIHNNYMTFKRILEQGGTIKVLLVTPNSSATELAAFRDHHPRNQKSYDNKIVQTLSEFCRMSRETKGNLQLRTINIVPSFGYYAFEPESSNGKVYLEHYSFKGEEDIPRILLTNADGFVYDAFVKQLKQLWEHGTNWECEYDAEDHMNHQT